MWGGALAYTMVGALFYRVIHENVPCDPRWTERLGKGCGTYDGINERTRRCPGCKARYNHRLMAFSWPVVIAAYLAYRAVLAAFLAIIYLPFRAAARAIAKPPEQS